MKQVLLFAAIVAIGFFKCYVSKGISIPQSKVLKYYTPLPFAFKRANFNRSGYWPDICEDLNPSHLNLTAEGTLPKKKHFPYVVGQKGWTIVEAGDKLDFHIASLNKSEPFKNYIIQCMNHALIAGKFIKKPDNQLIDCFGYTASTVMAADNSDKTNVTVTWRAPLNMISVMYFRATIIKDEHTYWTKEKAFRVTVSYNESLHTTSEEEEFWT